MSKFYKYVLPSLLTSVLSGLYGIIDGYFVGNMVGDNGLTAINIAWPITAFIQCFGLAIGIGGGVFISHLLGSGEEKRARNVEGVTLSILGLGALVITIVLFFLKSNLLALLGAEGEILKYGVDYIRIIILGGFFQILGNGLIPILRNKNRIMTAMTALLVGSFTNLVGDYIFINLLDMKLVGAAIASVLGQAIAAIIAIWALVRTYKGSKPTFKINFKDSFEIFKIGLAPFALTYSASILIIITNIVCLSLAGNNAVACYSIFSYVLYIFQMSAQGSADGIQPLISYNYGAKKYTNVKKLLKKIVLFTLCLEIILFIIILILEKYIPVLFGASAETTKIFLNGFFYFVSGFIFLSMVKVGNCFLYAIKQTRLANFLALIEPLFITPILLLTIPKLIGVNGIWLSFTITQVILFAMTLLMVVHKNKVLLKEKELTIES